MPLTDAFTVPRSVRSAATLLSQESHDLSPPPSSARPLPQNGAPFCCRPPS